MGSLGRQLVVLALVCSFALLSLSVQDESVDTSFLFENRRPLQHFRSGSDGARNGRSLNVNSVLPSFVRRFVQQFQDEQQQPLDPETIELILNEFYKQLFYGGISENCQSHVKEWFRRIALNTTGLGTDENAWVLHMIDSWGKSTEGILQGHINFFGDFNECVNIKEEGIMIDGKEESFSGRYCMAFLMTYGLAHGAAQMEPRESSINKMGSVGMQMEDTLQGSAGIPEGRKAVGLNEFINFFFTTKGIMAPKASTAVCFPDSCSQLDITRIIVNGQHILYSNSTDKTALPWIAPTAQLPCRVRDSYDGGIDGAAIGVIVLVSIFGLLAVGVGIYDYYLVHTKAKRPTGIVFKYFMAFSLYTNTKKWLSTRKSPEDFGCLHGMRSLTTGWVVLAHTYAINMFVPQHNTYDIFKGMEERWNTLLVINGFFCVDTFFVMSGALACFNVLKLLDKTKGKLNIPMFYLHRFLRLTPTYAILVAIGATLIKYLGNGPYWAIMEAQEKYCRDHWWTNLLYVNNLVHVGEMCNGESWYLANDMQFYILCPFLIWPIWKWEKIGLGLLLVYFLASCSVVPLLVNHYGTPPTTVITRVMTNFWQTHIYIRPYSRISVFFIGIFLGWLLFKTKGRKIKIPALVVIAGWMLSTAAALFVILCIHPWYDATYEIPKAYGYFYAGFSRPIWGLAISWIIFACVKGYGGPINDFLSWSAFMPLGRLTFCIYLTSYHLQQMYLLRSPFPPRFDEYVLINQFFGHFVLSCIFGYICTLIFESPFMILQKLIFEGDRRPPPKPQPVTGQVEAQLAPGEKVNTD